MMARPYISIPLLRIVIYTKPPPAHPYPQPPGVPVILSTHLPSLRIFIVLIIVLMQPCLVNRMLNGKD